MQFKAMERDKEDNGNELLFGGEELIVDEISEGRQTDQYLETPLGPKALQKRLLRLATDARISSGWTRTPLEGGESIANR